MLQNIKCQNKIQNIKHQTPNIKHTNGEEGHMYSIEQTVSQIDSLFNAKSVAIIGAPRGMKTGKIFLLALLDHKFKGRIYPVNPNADEIDGIAAYPSIEGIPGSVDLAIILVPSEQALPVVRACADKGVKGAVLFTAGYKETGRTQGIEMEKAILRVAKEKGMRLIGPNGMGLHTTKTGLSFFPQLSTKPGPVGILSSSGSLTNILGRVAPDKGVYFSKMVSMGNACDLSASDFLAYFASDPATRVIGAYIEGIRDGALFLKSLRVASLAKPVILWKVGMTKEGSHAASSHTGALAGAEGIWRGALKQGGAVSICGFEAWLDALMAFSLISSSAGDRMAIISGPGGLAVSAAEACGKAGLKLAELLPETQSKLAQFIPPTGTSFKNPIDVGLLPAFDIDIYVEAAKTAAKDPGVDALVVIGAGLSPEINLRYTKGFIRLGETVQKPLLMVKIPGFDENLTRQFCKAGIPFFDSAERAMQTYAWVRKYQKWRLSSS
jgi:acyl-CoA synthetase (NDP forming)